MKVLDLFSGIGGFSLGLERAGMQTVAFCEIDPFCRKVLAKHWPDVPIYEDVRELDAKSIGPVDVICGGYPCQGESYAGKRRGKEDDRWLWPEFMRLVVALRPAWVIGENVAGHVSMGLDTVLSDLEAEDYTARAFIIPACAVDAKHRRDRVWVIAYSNDISSAARSEPFKWEEGANFNWRSARSDVADTEGDSSRGLSERAAQAQSGPAQCSEDVAHSKRFGRRQMESSKFKGTSREGATGPIEHGCFTGRRARWKPEPRVGRVAHGVPRRVDRIRCLGNTVLPQIPEYFGRAIMETAA